MFPDAPGGNGPRAREEAMTIIDPQMSTLATSPRKTSAGEPYIVVVSQQVPRPRSSDALYEGIYEQFVARKDPAPRKTTPTGQQKS